MLRNRSRAVTGKQVLMTDHHHTASQSSSSSSYTKPVQNSFFGSPRFKVFASIVDQSLISPTSVLDSKSFFSLQIPFSNSDPPPKKPNFFLNNIQKFSGPTKKPIGLALIEEKHDDSKPSKSVIFSAKLRVLIPPPPPVLDSAVDGGGGGLMTVKEMEVCEEYTCVRRHGPNAKITHIFDNFVVKNFVDCDSEKFSMADLNAKKKKKIKNNTNDFLSFCYTCKNNLELTNDIYIYRYI